MILFDDLGWSIAKDHPNPEADGVKNLPKEEKETLQLGKVFDLLVSQHKSFHSFRSDDQWWGWAQKK